MQSRREHRMSCSSGGGQAGRSSQHSVFARLGASIGHRDGHVCAIGAATEYVEECFRRRVTARTRFGVSVRVVRRGIGRRRVGPRDDGVALLGCPEPLEWRERTAECGAAGRTESSGIPRRRRGRFRGANTQHLRGLGGLAARQEPVGESAEERSWRRAAGSRVLRCLRRGDLSRSGLARVQRS